MGGWLQRARADRDQQGRADALATAKTKQLIAAKKKAEQQAVALQHNAEEEAAVMILKVKPHCALECFECTWHYFRPVV